ncbi:hypothetical protein AVEN_85731-1 [Araneus ventricosus]|uniref:Uncharacterized protein n=1 Tax=Araneus ventricosus TaxID=182803 RepID=A0A4Y2VD77_ARAVE|nr:hypothetical protein AVEN_85731-1 [Araneus ventricosus]
MRNCVGHGDRCKSFTLSDPRAAFSNDQESGITLPHQTTVGTLDILIAIYCSESRHQCSQCNCQLPDISGCLPLFSFLFNGERWEKSSQERERPVLGKSDIPNELKKYMDDLDSNDFIGGY